MTADTAATRTAVSEELERRAIDVIRGLAMDAVQKANSGHPGTPMALAPLAHVLYTRVMRYDSGAPEWPNRDRFVLSAGHASMLLYAMLYLTGYGLELDDLKQFRQFGSRTPGHPEHRHTPGVEVTTGPLGQGFANGVGMAIVERNLRERFGADVTDHHVFAICSDGDLEEGVSHEAASLAGHLGLGKLVYVYDDNHISIDGPTELAYSDDVKSRFEGYHWHVVQLGEAAEDLAALEQGLRDGMAADDRPTLVILRSHIGYPSPKYTDTEYAHGNPLGEDEVAKVKEILGMPPEDFWVPDDVLSFYRDAGGRGRDARAAWEKGVAAARDRDPDLVADYDLCLAGTGRAGWEQRLPAWKSGEEIATRQASGKVLNAILDVVPGLIGGGADLTGNTGTEVDGAGVMERNDCSGRQLHFGVREHGMGSIMNGMALTGGALPFGGTFVVFSDYMRAAPRLAALSRAKVAFVWTHDSVGLGEDGPTHQPVEHLMAVRAIPELTVIRPADANEVSSAWRVHIDGDGPTALILTRQKLPVLEATAERAPAGVPAGAYALVDETGDAVDLVLIGTGSEVALCVTVRERLAADALSVRVVSMPSWELFAAQPPEYRDSVLPPGVPTLAVEAGVSLGWDRYADDVVAIDHFGASAPGSVVLERFGYNPDYVTARARALLGLAPPPAPPEGEA
ncbi:MAG TPA: transketolase [Acidimicrobiia bacterium]|nr:transketolase [Acidimicrobiia bacterium]